MSAVTHCHMLSLGSSWVWGHFCLDPVFPTCTVSSCLLYNREQIRLLQRSQFQSCGSDRTSIEGMIGMSKKWLKDFTRESKLYPLPGSLIALQLPAAGQSRQQEVSESGAVKH